MARTAGRRRGGRLLSVAVTVVMAVALLGAGGYLVARRSAGPPAQPDSFASTALLDAAAAAPAELDARSFQLVRPGGHGSPTADLPVPAPVASSAAPRPSPKPPAPRRQQPSAPASPSASAPRGSTLPLRVDAGASTQVITVVAGSSRATTATLTAWQRSGTGWSPVVGPVRARIGSAGVGPASETSTRTPAGTFSLTEAFGRSADPGTALPYRVIDPSDWWVSDPASPLYNRHTRCAPGTCPFDEKAGENLWAEGAVYDPALVIDYNRAGVPGRGSAFFLHVTNGAPTAGCVAIDRGSLVRVLRWLSPAARPLIALGVG